MNETKWTPGPLLSDAEGLVFKDDALGTQVANCRDAIYIPPAERAANARLYSAAPELFEALDAIASLWTLPEASNELVSRMINERVMGPAMAALAKARGAA